jgi:hypothetical protein
MSAELPISTVEHNGFNISSNVNTPETITESLSGSEPAKPSQATETPEGGGDQPTDLSRAASELGKAGGRAAAEKRAAAKEADEGDEAQRRASEEIESAPPDKKKKLASDRVGEATRDAAEAKRQLALERAERERLLREYNELRAKADKPEKVETADGDPEPKEEDFEHYRDYVKAQARWEARQIASELIAGREKEYQAQAQAQTYTQGVVYHVDTFNARLTKERESDPDAITRVDPRLLALEPSYMVAPGQSPNALNVMADEITSSESPLALMLYLTEHPEVSQRIASLRTPREISREMAKAEQAAIKAETREVGATAGNPPPKPPVSKASPPVRPVAGAPVVAEESFKPGMSVDDYARLWNKTQRPKVFQR